MIRGMGIDLVEVQRFEKISAGSDFLQQVFTEKEILDSQRTNAPGLYQAKSFAVKEAVLKALDIGLEYGSYWHDIKLNKKYEVVLSGRLQELRKGSTTSKIHVATAHSRHYAIAFVVLEG